MKKKILCALLCSLLVFSHSNVSVYAASQALSSEYQNSELRNDYIGTMTYQVPNEWEYDDSVSSSSTSRSYIIKKGNVFQISYMPYEIQGTFANDYSGASTIINSLINGLSEYNELTREQTKIGDYPALVVSYTWEADNGLVYSCSVAVCTNDGVYSFSTAISSAYRDTNLESDILQYTLASINTVSYSDQTIIKDVQSKLNSFGYNCGTPDGIAGSGTQAAIQKYRTDKNLTDDTQIDAELLNSLNDANNTATNTPSTEDSSKVSISFSSSVPNDVTGKWRLATTSSEADVTSYALNYYKAYFKSDDEIHGIVNKSNGTTCSLSVVGNLLSVVVHKYVEGEENDAKMLFAGDVIAEYFIDIETGEIEKL
ncbi:MAG: peptidoglycan-binding protein [Clostridiales bacterium]|nr:peptidoglycan-binding protein [Clostridiales bacterium]